jgi:hypothetical protein
MWKDGFSNGRAALLAAWITITIMFAVSFSVNDQTNTTSAHTSLDRIKSLNTTCDPQTNKLPSYCSLRPPPPIPVASEPQAELSLYEIRICSGLGIAYIHIFKNGGTTINYLLQKFCKVSTGKKPTGFASYNRDSRVASLEDICSQNLCFTFWREPVNRYFSSYHEVMRRYDRGIYKRKKESIQQILLPGNATMTQKVASFEKFLNLVETNELNDPHIRSQKKYLINPKSGNAVFPGLAVFELQRLFSVLPTLLCGAHDRCQPCTPCPYDEEWEGTSSRSRDDEKYRLGQYILEEDDVGGHILTRVASFYREDYCYFGIPRHPQLKGECNDG